MCDIANEAFVSVVRGAKVMAQFGSYNKARQPSRSEYAHGAVHEVEILQVRRDQFGLRFLAKCVRNPDVIGVFTRKIQQHSNAHYEEEVGFVSIFIGQVGTSSIRSIEDVASANGFRLR